MSCKTDQSEVFLDKDNGWTTKSITQNRDMTQYEQRGHFWCSRIPFGNEQDRFNGEKQVRDFIWRNWSEKKRGYIKISCGGTDTSNTIHYFIEPNEKEEWIIKIIGIYKHAMPKHDNMPIQFSIAVTVENAKDKNKSDNEIIILKSADDRIVGTIPNY